MSFYQEIYELVRQIPKGKVTTYGNIAKMLGRPRSSRVVGYALHVNPQPQTIPCHRVVNREGRLAPGFTFGGPDAQKQLLENEGVVVGSDDCVDLKKYLW